MRKIILFTISTLLGGLLYSQSIKFDSNKFDFGKINEKDGVVTHVFQMKNISEKPFIIGFIATGCGCTAIEYDKSPIMPGQSRALKVNFDPKGRVGPFKTMINILSTSKDEYKLSITGQVVPEEKSLSERFPLLLENRLRATNNYFAYGIVPTAEEHSTFIEIYNPTNVPVKLEVISRKKHGSVRVYPSEIAPYQSSNVIYTIDLVGESYLGEFNDTVSLKIDGILSRTNLTVSATVIPNFFDLTPQQVKDAPIVSMPSIYHYFTSAKSGDVLSKKFTIKNGGKSDLIIEKVLNRSKDISYQVKKSVIKSGESGEITISWDTKGVKGDLSRRVTLLFNAPQSPIKTIIVTTKID